MSTMFNETPRLTELNISSFKFSKFTSYTSIFDLTNNSINVIFKDDSSKTFIQNALGDGVGTITIATA